MKLLGNLDLVSPFGKRDNVSHNDYYPEASILTVDDNDSRDSISNPTSGDLALTLNDLNLNVFDGTAKCWKKYVLQHGFQDRAIVGNCSNSNRNLFAVNINTSSI